MQFPIVVEKYSDANWFLILMVQNELLVMFSLWVKVHYHATKQTIILQSTMEAKIIALDIDTAEAEFLTKLYIWFTNFKWAYTSYFNALW